MSEIPKSPRSPRIPIAEDPDRLTKSARRLLDSAGLTNKLCKHFTRDDRCPSGVAFVLEPTGIRCAPEAAEELIRKGKFRPCADSLFPGLAQTFEVAS